MNIISRLVSMFRRKKHDRVKIHPYPVTMQEFRALSENRNSANRVLNSPEFIMMYSVLVNERPSKKLIMPIPTDFVAQHAAYSKGYEDCLERFQLLGVSEGVEEIPEMTFRTED